MPANIENPGKGIFKSTRFLWVFIILLVSAIFLENSRKDDPLFSTQVNKINRKTEKLVNAMVKDMSFIEEFLKKNEFNVLVEEYDPYIEQIAEIEDYSIYVFRNDSLIMWSDNSIPVSAIYSENDFNEGLDFVSNTWGLCRTAGAGVYKITGIVHLQRDYPYENKFLKNDFLLGSGLSAKFRVSGEREENAIEIGSGNNEPFFYLIPVAAGVMSGKEILVIIFYLLTLLALLLFYQDLYVFCIKLWRSNWWIVALILDFILIRWLMIKFSFPGALYSTQFFETFEHGSFFFNSHGDLLISGLFIFLTGFNLQKVFSLYPRKKLSLDDPGNKRIIDSFTILGWISILVVFLGLTRLFESVLTERDELIEVFKVLSLNIINISDLLFFIMVLAGFSFFVKTVIYQIVPQYKPGRLAMILTVTLVLVIVFSRFFEFHTQPVRIILLLGLVAIFILSAYKGHSRLNHSYSVLAIIAGSLFLIQLFYSTNQEKEYLLKRQLLDNLANEHDIIAEMLFEVIDQEIVNDEDLSELVMNPDISEKFIRTYLISNHFGYYWNRYDISANICDSLNLVNIIPENREDLCLNFFNAPIIEDGSRIEGTGFYYLDNFDGRINYRGKYVFYNQDSTYATHLFISLDSRLMPQEMVYPDLLVSGNYAGQDSILKGYSYAKYQQGTLVSKTGDYVYSTESHNYPEELDRIVPFTEDNYEHMIYKFSPGQTIVLSSPRFRLWDHVVSFSYVFVFLYLLWLIIRSLYFFPWWIKGAESRLKQKIELVMVGVLLVSFIVIGGGISYYIIDQYNNTSRNTISEKTQSVLIEMRHKLNEEPMLTTDWSSEGYPTLGDLLIKFSYVFNSDINLFDPRGDILATSRPEVFERKLVSNKMDPVAYHELSVHNKMEFVHYERIGDMKYLSAYVPFYNMYNDLVAYLNLPYFAMQSIIRQEISTFIVAILNAYFLLIFLAVVLAVFLSNQVTKPLRLLQEKFTRIELGGINQMVDYRKKDEIGSLVKSYNRMVEELEESADKLAKSERETAWREMARQIAHEIKNPLTPMKLSVQHLRRAWDDRAEDWDAYFDRVSQTLIEQINSLSAIADEFAQFARMPQSKLKVMDLVKKVKKSVSLFEFSESGKITVIDDGLGEIPVYADEEQLQQVFNNLLKNAFQSVPKSRQPKIEISFEVQGDKVVVSFKDNGSGVDPDISERLFQPNFTTKSSGMGLGLAISKSIIESSGGHIWYESAKGGSTFFISLPVYKN